MAYRGINPSRFDWLLLYGVRVDELQRFFRECRIPLVQAGAKVQNIPHGDKDRRAMLTRGIPSAGDPVIGKWFRKNMTVVDPIEPFMILAAFERVERTDTLIPEASLRELARSCLFFLFQEDPPKELAAFLATPLVGSDKSQAETVVATISTNVVVSSPVGSPLDELAVLDVISAMVLDQDPDPYLSRLPETLAAVIAAMWLVRHGQVPAAMETIAGIPQNDLLRKSFNQFVSAQSAAAMGDEHKGLTKAAPSEFTGGFDCDADQIVGYCTNSASPSSVFVTPVLVLKNGDLYALGTDERQQLFPENGDVMAFPGAGLPRQPKRGEIGIWSVVEHQTRGSHQRTRFHLSSEKQPVYEVRHVPFSSTEHDSVREYLQQTSVESSSDSRQSSAPQLLVLQDHLIIKPPRDFMDLSKAESYEEPFLMWEHLVSFPFEGRQYVRGPLPQTSERYECAPVGTIVRRLFAAARKVDGRQTITRSQIAEISKLLDGDVATLDTARISRLRASLARVAERSEVLDTIAEELLLQPKIQARVEAAIANSIAKATAEKAQLRDDVARLIKERDEWEERVRLERLQMGKLPKQLTQAVLSAFEQAQAAGVKTLAESAVIGAMLGAPRGHVLSASAERHSRHVQAPIITTMHASGQTPEGSLNELGIRGSFASALVSAMVAIKQAGLVLCLKGKAARVIARGLATAFTQGGAIAMDVPIGVLEDEAINRVLSHVPRTDVLLICDANLSASELYLRGLTDFVAERLSRGGNSASMVFVMLTQSEGVSSLPMDPILAAMTVNLDLDLRPGTDPMDVAQLFDPEIGMFSRKLWPPAARALREALGRLSDDSRQRACAVLEISAQG